MSILFASLLLRRFRRFASEQKGSVNIEALLFFPLLITVIAASLVLFDGFRRDGMTQKATYAVGDMLSRETAAITPTYLDGARALMASIVNAAPADVTLRVTEVIYDAHSQSYGRSWSHVAGSGAQALSSSDVNARAGALPGMAHGERLIMVESFVAHRWAVDIGLADDTLQSLTLTRPRFAPQLAWSD